MSDTFDLFRPNAGGDKILSPFALSGRSFLLAFDNKISINTSFFRRIQAVIRLADRFYRLRRNGLLAVSRQNEYLYLPDFQTSHFKASKIAEI